MEYNNIISSAEATAKLHSLGIKSIRLIRLRNRIRYITTKDNETVAIYAQLLNRLYVIKMNYKFTKTYQRGLSVEDIENANPCQAALNKFAWLAMKDGYKYDIWLPLENVIKYASQCEGGLHWLEEHGIIEIESDFKYIGQYFKKNNDYYMLVRTDREPLVILINLYHSSRIKNPVLVENPLQITKEEFYLISGGCPNQFKPIKGIIISSVK